MKNNTQLVQLVSELRKHSDTWKTVARDLERPGRVIVNLGTIENSTKENDVVLVPGKVLGDGELNHKLTIAAFSFSDNARSKIVKSKGHAYSIIELLKIDPKGEKMMILK